MFSGIGRELSELMDAKSLLGDVKALQINGRNKSIEELESILYLHDNSSWHRAVQELINLKKLEEFSPWSSQADRDIFETIKLMSLEELKEALIKYNHIEIFKDLIISLIKKETEFGELRKTLEQLPKKKLKELLDDSIYENFKWLLNEIIDYREGSTRMEQEYNDQIWEVGELVRTIKQYSDLGREHFQGKILKFDNHLMYTEEPYKKYLIFVEGHEDHIHLEWLEKC